MNLVKKLAIALFAASVLGVAAAPSARADGIYVRGSYGAPSAAYWDPACRCWVYPSYTYRPAPVYYPAYTTYAYPQYYYPYYSRPTFSVGFSFGSGRYYGGYGGYGRRAWRR